MKRKNIIWDFDGTLYDTYGDIVASFSSVLEESYSRTIASARIHELVKVDTKHCAEVLANEFGLDQQELLTSARAAYNSLDTDNQRPFEGARDVCDKVIAAGGQNFLVTHRDRKSLDAMLARHDFHSVFTEIVTADDGFPQKPAPDSFDYLLDKHKLARSMSYGVGDRELDVLAANASDISSVYFCPQGGEHDKADMNISALSALLDVIG